MKENYSLVRNVLRKPKPKLKETARIKARDYRKGKLPEVGYSMRWLDHETIEILVEDKIATGG